MAMSNKVAHCKVVSGEITCRLRLNVLEAKEERSIQFVIRKDDDGSIHFIEKGTEGEECTK